MRSVSFTEAVMVAAASALLAGGTFHAASLLLPVQESLRLVVLLLGLCQVLWLVVRARRPDGRILALAGWALVSAITVILDPPLLFYVIGQVALLWVVRALIFHRRALHGLADACACGLGLMAALWALHASGSVSLAAWSLLLCQALPFLMSPTDRLTPARDQDVRYQDARRAAEMALRRAAARD
jgi:hypothetical protein